MAPPNDERGLRDAMLKRQRTLIRETYYIRSVIGSPPMAAAKGAADRRDTGALTRRRIIPGSDQSPGPPSLQQRSQTSRSAR